MSRVTSTILVILILMNSSVTIMEGSGLADDLGVELAPGVGETMDDIVENAKDGFSVSGGLGNTLFSMFAAGIGVMRLIVETTFAAPQMFLNLGFPSWFIVPIFAPVYVISLLELTYAATGRDLV